MKQNEFDIETLVAKQNPRNQLKEYFGGGIYLSMEEQRILQNYQIPYQKYTNIKSLIFDIENELNEENQEDLESVLDSLVELDYYQNIRQ